jgi:long-chain acyl-CoA synthetase
VAIIVPDFETVLPMCEKEGICPGKCTPASVVKDPKLKAIFMKEMEKTGKQYGLKGFENVVDIVLESEMFSVDNQLLTPTLKVKRQSVLDSMYILRLANVSRVPFRY